MQVEDGVCVDRSGLVKPVQRSRVSTHDGACGMLVKPQRDGGVREDLVQSASLPGGKGVGGPVTGADGHLEEEERVYL